MQYYNNKQENDLVDPSSDKLGVNLLIKVDPSLPECPGVLKNKLGALKSIAGWTNSILGAPTFDASKIKDCHQLINDKLTKNLHW